MMTTDEGDVERPTCEQVAAAIEALDGESRTMVTLAPSPPNGSPVGECHMAIGGGPDHFIVYLTRDNLGFTNLVEPERQTRTNNIRLFIGGQEGDYTESQCVTRPTAIRAARHYLERGNPDPTLTWLDT